MGEPGGRRLPFISTSVRIEPRPRRSSVEVPLAPLAKLVSCARVKAGRVLSRSMVSTAPTTSNACSVMVCTGLEETTFFDVSREPVTVMVSGASSAALAATSFESACCAKAALADIRANAEMIVDDSRTRRELRSDICLFPFLRAEPGAGFNPLMPPNDPPSGPPIPICEPVFAM